MKAICQEQRPLEVLVSAYACAPTWGSEIGMGWNWVRALSQHCNVTVITEEGFRADLSKGIHEHQLGDRIRPVFVDIGHRARRQFWNQGDWRFYRHYRRWQREAYAAAAHLVTEHGFDLVHQLNMIGYREPGYLWRLDLPFVWGPVGGHDQMPWAYLPYLGLNGCLRYACRNVLNFVQTRTSFRVHRAATRAGVVLAATKANRDALRNVHHVDAVLLNETGAGAVPQVRKVHPPSDPLRLVWCGKFIGQKALPIALHAVKRASRSCPVALDIVGAGPYEARWRALAQELGVAPFCTFHGSVDHLDALSIIGRSDCLVFTSLQEGTPATVLEALALGIPVICHDACGFGDVVDSSCGTKIPVRSPRESVELFARAIQTLAGDRERLGRLAVGALARAREVSWDAKARFVVQLYERVIGRETLE